MSEQRLIDGLAISDKALSDFNALRNMKVVSTRDLSSAHNWIDGQKPLVRSESQIFNRCGGAISNDFVYLGHGISSEDSPGDPVER